ncbi:hypothetical protein Golob_020821 [Gossypium lobatum]|uniref:RNase H type-1 domain-containing protein n=1 Tax=Gossypium lobatum TaxID=34289 RepID=A0A7J8LBY4_9ROSI|nr:hypothetical protein [Gossypium lobatum]
MDCLFRDIVTEDGLWNLDLFRCLQHAQGEFVASMRGSMEFGLAILETSEGKGVHMASSQTTVTHSGGKVKVVSGDVVVEEVLRDDQGRWILGFNRRLGQCSIFNVELWGILDGLLLLQNRRCDKVLIRTNNMEVIQAIQEAFTLTSFSTLISRIHQLLQEIGQWKFEHIN